jgi:hypothetical protein
MPENPTNINYISSTHTNDRRHYNRCKAGNRKQLRPKQGESPEKNTNRKIEDSNLVRKRQSKVRLSPRDIVSSRSAAKFRTEFLYHLQSQRFKRLFPQMTSPPAFKNTLRSFPSFTFRTKHKKFIFAPR